MAHRQASLGLVKIQVHVPRSVHDKLVKLQKDAKDLRLSQYCRRVLIEHVEAKSK